MACSINERLVVFLEGRCDDAADISPAYRLLSEKLRDYPLPIVCGLALRPLGAPLAVCADVQTSFFGPLLETHCQRWCPPDDVGTANRMVPSPINQLSDPHGAHTTRAGVAESYEKLTAAQLKTKCHTLGLLTGGSRAELKDRLVRAAQRGIAPRTTGTPLQSVVEAPQAAHDVRGEPPTADKNTKVSIAAFLEPLGAASSRANDARRRQLPSTVAASVPSSVTLRGGASAVQLQHEVVVVLDKRERVSSTHGAFVALFGAAPTTSGPANDTAWSPTVLSHTLPIGDIVFASRRATAPGGGGNPPSAVAGVVTDADMTQYAYYPVLLERKTFRDLLNSVTSSHLAEQKQLMLLSPFKVLVLVVEGSTAEWMKLTAEEQRRITSSCLTASLVDGMRVLRTRSPADTVAVAKALAAKLPQFTVSLPQSRCSAREVDDVTAKLRSELQRNSLAVRMVSCVAGVSTSFARELLEAVYHATTVGGGSKPVATARSLVVPGDVDRPMSSIVGLWAFSKWLGQQQTVPTERQCAHAASNPKAVGVSGTSTNDAFLALRDGLARSTLDSTSRKQAFALLTHFLCCDVY